METLLHYGQAGQFHFIAAGPHTWPYNQKKKIMRRLDSDIYIIWIFYIYPECADIAFLAAAREGGGKK